MVAADVRPVIEPRACIMVPAPMKPIPVTTCAAMRPGSPMRAPPNEVPRFIERSMNNAEPTQMRMFVRRPAAFPAIWRSKPIAPPARMASSSFVMRSRRKASTISESGDDCSASTAISASVVREGQPHPVLHVGDCFSREDARLRRACVQRLRHALRVCLELHRALANRREFLHQIPVQYFLAVDASPLCAATVHLDLGDRRRRREGAVELVDQGTVIGLAGIES